MANLKLIRDLCKERGITFRELCKRVERDESAIQSAIRRNSTKTDTLEAIAKELRVPVGYFFEGYSHENETKKYEQEISQLKSEIQLLKEMLADKERTIQLLIEKKKSL